MKKLMMAVWFAAIVAAAGAEWLIVRYSKPICFFVLSDPHVPVVRMAFVIAGSVIIAVAVAICAARRIAHCKHALVVASDRVALRGFVLAMLFAWIFCFTLTYEVGCDATRFEAAAMALLALFGSMVAVRAKDKGWMAIYFLLWVLAGSLYPAG